MRRVVVTTLLTLLVGLVALTTGYMGIGTMAVEISKPLCEERLTEILHNAQQVDQLPWQCRVLSDEQLRHIAWKIVGEQFLRDLETYE